MTPILANPATYRLKCYVFSAKDQAEMVSPCRRRAGKEGASEPMNKPTFPVTVTKTTSFVLLTIAVVAGPVQSTPPKTGWDLVLFSYTGTRKGEFDGGPESPEPRVTIFGARADLVYDDAKRQVRLTNFRR